MAHAPAGRQQAGGTLVSRPEQGNWEEGREGSAKWEGWQERGKQPIVSPVLACSPHVRVRDEVGTGTCLSMSSFTHAPTASRWWWWVVGWQQPSHDMAVARDHDAVHM